MDASGSYNEHQGKCDYMNILRSQSNIGTIKNISPYRAVNTNHLHYQSDRLILSREIIGVCCGHHTKNIEHTLCRKCSLLIRGLEL